MKTIEELREEATEWLDVSPTGMAFRSCWNCNSAHEHLKQATYPFCCFSCGSYFYKGVDITEYEEE
jgi:endogenous inhibitor of DNA gyrase (YacG/DUF329 family)